jgi:hypothetical protein
MVFRKLNLYPSSRQRKELSFSGESLFIFFFFTDSTAPSDPGLCSSFMIVLQKVGLLGWVISSSQSLYLNAGQHKHRIDTYTHHTSMPWVGFETMIPASERTKTVHALDGLATVTGSLFIYSAVYIYKILYMCSCVKSNVTVRWMLWSYVISGYHSNVLWGVNTMLWRKLYSRSRKSNFCFSVSCLFCQYW